MGELWMSLVCPTPSMHRIGDMGFRSQNDHMAVVEPRFTINGFCYTTVACFIVFWAILEVIPASLSRTHTCIHVSTHTCYASVGAFSHLALE